MTDPAAQLKQAVSSLRTVGTVFLLFGALAAIAVWHDRMMGTLRIVPFVLMSSLLWVGPGVLYHVTAVLIRRHDARIALLARRTAVAQSALAVAAVVASYAGGAFARGRAWSPATVPAMVTLFFIPALLAQAYQIGVALEALRHLPMPGHGFQVQPLPVLPADDEVTNAGAE